jgi:peptidylprolyl isomerase
VERIGQPEESHRDLAVAHRHRMGPASRNPEQSAGVGKRTQHRATNVPAPIFAKNQPMKNIFATTLLRFSLLAAVGATGLLSTACKKDEESTPQDYSAIDDAIITKYITDNSITTAQKQPSGLYYVPILTNANAERAVAGKTVTVVYTGRFMDGRVFDASALTGFRFGLGNGEVIKGWDEGIALMHKGDKATLLIPSALAYGSSGRSSIPANTVLRFEVELKNIQ